MAIYQNWMHGSALAVQSPEMLEQVDYVGWGADMRVKGGKAPWFHIPIPSPAFIGNLPTKLLRVFVDSNFPRLHR
jgi:hypothetical protein